jgi:hypothetical protein
VLAVPARSTLMATRMPRRVPALTGGLTAFAGLRMVWGINVAVMSLSMVNLASVALTTIEVSEAMGVESKIGR